MLFQPILALDIMNFFKFAKLLAGGGGGQNDMFAPQYFHWGGGTGAFSFFDLKMCNLGHTYKEGHFDN